MHRDQAVSLLAEFILRERKVTKKGAIAQAYIEVIEALRVIGNVPCPRCTDLRRENAELRGELGWRSGGDAGYRGPTPVAKGPAKVVSAKDELRQASAHDRKPLKNQPPLEPGQ